MDASVILKPGKDKAVRNHHHWIFSGAVASFPEFDDGSILAVRSAAGELLGHAYFNRRASICGRMLSFGKTPPEDAIRENVAHAVSLRQRYFEPAVTNAYRLINAEGDRVPGLIVDLYGDVLVVQSATLGMDRLKPFILELLVETLKPRGVYEKSDLPSRREEGLSEAEGLLCGEDPGRVRILENRLSFIVDVARSQKTGFYLDQREMRKLAGEFASGRRVLNAFSYTGAFSVHALKGGAVRADAIDSSEAALRLARENVGLNGYGESAASFINADVFTFLRGLDAGYDFIILDPPAFAKKKTDVIQACRGYKDINRLALQKIERPGLLMTFSCSHFVDEGLFQQVVFQASQEAGRRVRILQRHRQAVDHPVNVFHPETAYLKGFLLYVD